MSMAVGGGGHGCGVRVGVGAECVGGLVVFTALASHQIRHSAPTRLAAPLPDGDVLIAGGVDSTPTVLS
ncbi:MAG: hypothetical protein ACRDKD_10705, partial [Solirubrobacteraceae bacterium]